MYVPDAPIFVIFVRNIQASPGSAMDDVRSALDEKAYPGP